MTTINENDYRSSHLHRGDVYDRNICGSPFDAYMAQMERVLLERIVPELFPDGIPRYLDFACGTARIAELVSGFTREAIGVDISESMLEEARTKCPTIRFVHADLTRDDSLDLGQFDLVSSFRFFGNAQSALRHQVLAVLASLVKPGGYLIINNHRNPRALATLLHRATGGTVDMDLTHAMLCAMLFQHGFQVVHSYPIGAWLWRSSMQTGLGNLDERLLKREKMFGYSFFAPIAPDTILVARRGA